MDWTAHPIASCDLMDSPSMFLLQRYLLQPLTTGVSYSSLAWSPEELETAGGIRRVSTIFILFINSELSHAVTSTVASSNPSGLNQEHPPLGEACAWRWVHIAESPVIPYRPAHPSPPPPGAMPPPRRSPELHPDILQDQWSVQLGTSVVSYSIWSWFSPDAWVPCFLFTAGHRVLADGAGPASSLRDYAWFPQLRFLA
jgi:hypothetical protein